MKNAKMRIFSGFVAAALALSALLPAAGAATAHEQVTMAQGLKSLGLFEGYRDTDFGLADAASREQALVFQLRVLGEDAAARAWTGSCPYTDVPAGNWATPYIGYATEKGYAKGVGSGKFGFGSAADAKMITAFLLRGLGYGDADFTYENCLTFAMGKGLLETDVAPPSFLRGDAAVLLFRALNVTVKGTEDALLVALAKKGAVTGAQLTAFDAIVSAAAAETPPAPVTRREYEDAIKQVMGGYDAMDAAVVALMAAVEQHPDHAHVASAKVALNEATAALGQLSASLKAVETAVPAPCAASYRALVRAVDTYTSGVEDYIKHLTTGDTALRDAAVKQFTDAGVYYKAV